MKCLNRVIPLFEKHDFWSTQPTMKVFEPIGTTCGPIEQKHVNDIGKEGLALPDGYTWCSVDMTQKETALELYDLLTNHYVEDDGGSFRFDYSVEFL